MLPLTDALVRVSLIPGRFDGRVHPNIKKQPITFSTLWSGRRVGEVLEVCKRWQQQFKYWRLTNISSSVIVWCWSNRRVAIFGTVGGIFLGIFLDSCMANKLLLSLTSMCIPLLTRTCCDYPPLQKVTPHIPKNSIQIGQQHSLAANGGVIFWELESVFL